MFFCFLQHLLKDFTTLLESMREDLDSTTFLSTLGLK